MARNSSNDDGMTVDSKGEKKLKRKKTKPKVNGNDEELLNKPEVKVKKSKRKRSESSETIEEDVPKKAKKAQKEKSANIEKGDEEVEEDMTKKAERKGVKKTKKETLCDTEKADEGIEEHAPRKSKKPSKRQLKREKKEVREAEKRDASKFEAMNNALEYISTWKHAKSRWKFEKLKQIWLMDHLLDDKSVPEEIFSTVLEYFEGCKGMARELLLKKGMDVIKKYERQQEASEEIEETVEYKRARQLLQAIPTET